MDYHFAALSPDRFQRFCQALLLTRYDRIQCFPTGQPDGGRDASQRDGTNLSDTTIFQVKFSTNPDSKSERDAVQKLIKSEESKIHKLVKRGATRYIFMTNIKGTGHQDSGSIDCVNKFLSEAFNIPVFCYWQDELSRELDRNSCLKWSYPEILKATDILRQLVFSSASTLDEPQKRAVKSFLAYQAREDANLKFKQIEITESITSLFVDVPAEIVFTEDGDKSDLISLKKSTIDRIHFATRVHQTFSQENQYFDEHSDEPSSAYQILTNLEFMSNSKRVVLEGAPGQGKSTVTQFLSQVNRLILLGRGNEIDQLNEHFFPKTVALPIRVDTRDYATWLQGYNPFSVAEVVRPIDASDALENFLAWMICQATGSGFTVDHLLSFLSGTKLLIVLDGFDEVAESVIREQIVLQVSAATERLKETCSDFQLIVTSRPTAFANSPGFPKDEWTYVQLQSLTKGVINQYASQWLRGGGLKDEKDKQQILKVLNGKLSQPHIRDLARNPMQLAILLSLISVQGASLPDQRTALYDRYIDIFLNRESEKSTTVRDNRATLIEIHQFLAWKLHSESEINDGRSNFSGSIAKTELIKVISEFLTFKGYSDLSLVDELFAGLVERVVALVSRTQDTFEFEVQPMREYFAARWLYNTSPYSPPGRNVPGTRIDRFNAISRNFYWQNVTRFMAGCYDIGELASIEDSIVNFSEDKTYSNIVYPVFLGLTLLNDYIFEQQPRIANRLISRLIKNKSIDRLVSTKGFGSRGDEFYLPKNSGQSQILDYFKNQIILGNMKEQELRFCSRQLISFLSDSDLAEFWNEQKDRYSDDLKAWIELGYHLNILRTLSKEALTSLYNEFGSKLTKFLLLSQRFDFVDEHSEIWQEAFDYKLNSNHARFGFFEYSMDSDDDIEFSSEPEVIRHIFSLINFLWYIQSDFIDMSYDPVNNSTVDAWIQRCFGGEQKRFSNRFTDLLSTKFSNLSPIIDLLGEVSQMNVRDFLNNVQILDQVLSKLVYSWGLSIYTLSLTLEFAEVLNSDCDFISKELVTNEFDTDSLLTFALKLKGMPEDSWISLFSGELMNDIIVKSFLLSAAARWAPNSFVFDRNGSFQDQVNGLTEDEFSRIPIPRRNVDRDIDVVEQSEFKMLSGNPSICLSERVYYLLRSRLSATQIEEFIDTIVSFNGFQSDLVLNSAMRYCFSRSVLGKFPWEKFLDLAKTCKQDKILSRFPHPRGDASDIPEDIALQVLKSADVFPTELVRLAELTINEKIGLEMVPIADVAKNQNWFVGPLGLPDI